MLTIHFGEMENTEYGPFEIRVDNENRIIKYADDYIETAIKYL